VTKVGILSILLLGLEHDVSIGIEESAGEIREVVIPDALLVVERLLGVHVPFNVQLPPSQATEYTAWRSPATTSMGVGRGGPGARMLLSFGFGIACVAGFVAELSDASEDTVWRILQWSGVAL
jgi:hypothetical protein